MLLLNCAWTTAGDTNMALAIATRAIARQLLFTHFITYPPTEPVI
jgi:hypothetical protein